VLRELQTLCDAVPAFPTAEAMDLLERELGVGSIHRLFEGLDRSSVPIAAASLGQVYCCRLREPGIAPGKGALVAVKVQRPDMIAAVSLDLHLLRRYMRVVECVKGGLMAAGVLGERKQFDIELLDAFASASFLELDYRHEAANQVSLSEPPPPPTSPQPPLRSSLSFFIFFVCTHSRTLKMRLL